MKNLFRSGLLMLLAFTFAHVNAQTGNQKTTNSQPPVVKCLPDSYEPNDAMFNATIVQAGREHTALICEQGDVDWFELQIPANVASLSVMVSDNPGDFDMELYDSNSSLVAGSYTRGETHERIVINNPNPKSYFVKVYGYNNDFRPAATYTFRYFLTSLPLSQTNPTVWRTIEGQGLDESGAPATGKTQVTAPQQAVCVNDMYEPNDFLLKAVAVSVNTEHKGKVCDGGDEDWFEFVVPKYTPKAVFHLSDIGIDLDMEIYDQAGNIITGSYRRGETDEKVTMLNPPPATYIVRVYAFNNNFDVDNFYTLRCLVSPPPVTQPAVHTLRYTSATPATTDLKIYPNPVVDGRMNISFGATGLSLVRIRMYDHVGSQVLETEAKSVDGQNIVVVPTGNLPAGFYMVEIVNGKQRTIRKVTINN